jgi:translation initiation factor IF-2
LAKNLKINIKNTQIAEAISLGSIKDKLAKKKAAEGDLLSPVPSVENPPPKEAKKGPKAESQEMPAAMEGGEEEAPRIRARSKSAFSDSGSMEGKPRHSSTEGASEGSSEGEEGIKSVKSSKKKTNEELRKEIFAEELAEQHESKKLEDHKSKSSILFGSSTSGTPPQFKDKPVPLELSKETPVAPSRVEPEEPSTPAPNLKLGPTGRHVNDLLPPKQSPPLPSKEEDQQPREPQSSSEPQQRRETSQGRDPQQQQREQGSYDPQRVREQRPYDPNRPQQQRPPYDPNRPQQQRPPYDPNRPQQQRPPYDPNRPQQQRPPYDPNRPQQQRPPYDPNRPQQQRPPYDPNRPQQQRPPYDPNRPQQQRPPYDPNRPQQQRPPYDPNRPRPPYDPNRPQQQRPPYDPNRPRPPYDPNRPQQQRPPYDPNRPRPPYDPNRPRPPYDPNRPRPPYDPNRPQQQRPYDPNRPQQQRPYDPNRPRPSGFAPEGKDGSRAKPRQFGDTPLKSTEDEAKKTPKVAKFKEFRDVKPQKRHEGDRSFDVRDRQGLRATDEDGSAWRKKRQAKQRPSSEEMTVRPVSLEIRIPISIKDLAVEMKLKSSQLIQKLFLQGLVVTINDLLEDETTLQLLGQEFGCKIRIDSSEEQRLRITDKNIAEEIRGADPAELTIRPPVVAFMGHVDHGKTSLIDIIRKSNRAAGEAGAITQHIGAFRCHTAVGDIAILDTPGHEAFSAMRARGAVVTDIIVLVIAGDEGIRQQTLEAIQHAKTAQVTMVACLNKCDKPNFNAENVYRQLADQELLPEAWGGQTITVNCSATTGEGIPQLLEMLALQAEVLELKANPNMRARGTVLESELHKGMGAVATILVQNGTLKLGDALVFGENWGRVKTMRDEYGKELKEAGPSTPIEITGISGLPEAGQEFIVVKSDKEAREIAEGRMHGSKLVNLQLKKKVSMENLMQQAAAISKKTLNVVLRADVQGSLEALKIALEKIQSTKAELNIIFAGVGEVSESDVQLAAASKAIILGFHTAVESHAETLIKQLSVPVRLHDIIYHAIDDVRLVMLGLLDKIAQETDKGKAEVIAVFKSSQIGAIAGCQVIEGAISRNSQIRLKRNGEIIWKGGVASLKRVKEDVREVLKGFECGILLNGFSSFEVGDILEAFEVTYITQEL